MLILNASNLAVYKCSNVQISNFLKQNPRKSLPNTDRKFPKFLLQIRFRRSNQSLIIICHHSAHHSPVNRSLPLQNGALLLLAPVLRLDVDPLCLLEPSDQPHQLVEGLVDVHTRLGAALDVRDFQLAGQSLGFFESYLNERKGFLIDIT